MSDDEDACEMSGDIPTLLRGPYSAWTALEAADEIERLRAELERLRAELRTYTGDGHNTKGEPCTPNTPS